MQLLTITSSTTYRANLSVSVENSSFNEFIPQSGAMYLACGCRVQRIDDVLHFGASDSFVIGLGYKCYVLLLLSAGVATD